MHIPLAGVGSLLAQPVALAGRARLVHGGAGSGVLAAGGRPAARAGRERLPLHHLLLLARIGGATDARLVLLLLLLKPLLELAVAYLVSVVVLELLAGLTLVLLAMSIVRWFLIAVFAVFVAEKLAELAGEHRVAAVLVKIHAAARLHLLPESLVLAGQVGGHFRRTILEPGG